MSENEKYKKELEYLREEINKIDEKIIDLLNKRGEIVVKIGNNKNLLDLDVYQPVREKEIIDRVKAKSTILKPGGVEEIWKEIMGACKAIQGSISKVGYLGPQGTFTHQAALEFFPKASTEFIACKSILEIFENIEKDILEFGVIAIENSLQGTVRETLDYLIEKNLIIYGEIELKISQNLISLKEANFDLLKTIFSHPQAFAQTRGWIKTNLPKAELISTSSTSAAVQYIKELNDLTNAAIGTTIASNIYDLKVLNSKIEDIPDNFTRFLVISKKENELKKGKVKTSIVYIKAAKNGTHHLLSLFLNLVKIVLI